MAKLKGSEERAGRLLAAAWKLAHGEAVTSVWFCERFDVSRATAKRDLVTLERSLPVAATGGVAWQGPRSLKTI